MGLEEETLDKYFLHCLCQGMQYAEKCFFKKKKKEILTFASVLLWYTRILLALKDEEKYSRYFLCGQLLVSYQNILVNIVKWKALDV